MSIRAEEGTYYWSNGYAHGTITVSRQDDTFGAKVSVDAGNLELTSLSFIGTGNQMINTITMKGDTSIAEGESREYNDETKNL